MSLDAVEFVKSKETISPSLLLLSLTSFALTTTCSLGNSLIYLFHVTPLSTL